MARLFGTDGVRGLANGDLTPELATAVAAAAARVLAEDMLAADRSNRRPVAVVGRDTRASGEMLEAAVIAGLTSAGADVLVAGVLPTPALALLTDRAGADVGIVLSASHNPMPDNGIKLFARGGHKLPDAVEDHIQAMLHRPFARPTGAGVGRVRALPEAREAYLEHLLSAVTQPLDGLRVVVDCAHGAAYDVAPEAYRRAGAAVTAIGAAPDGLNINDGCGSTHLAPLISTVLATGADLGVAHDGDADRCLAVDHTGNVVDGDAILAICALALRDGGRLRADTVVATVMSNLGLHHAMRAAGITLRTTPVGDRYVLEELNRDGLSLGGEQSGHMIFREYATTGDGLLTALTLMSRMKATGQRLATLAEVLRRLPQVLLNVKVADKLTVASSDQVAGAVNSAQDQLGDSGRILLRPSGTEHLVRVMVEAPTQAQADEIAHRLAEVVASA